MHFLTDKLMFKHKTSYSRAEDFNKPWFSVCHRHQKTVIFASFIPKQCFIDTYSSSGEENNQLGVLGIFPKIPSSFFSHEWFEKLADEDELWLNMLLSQQTWSKDACSCQDLLNDLQFCGWCRHIRNHKKSQKPPDLMEIYEQIEIENRKPFIVIIHCIHYTLYIV